MNKKMKRQELIEKIEELQKELLKYSKFDSVVALKPSTSVKEVNEFKENIKKMAEVESVQELGLKQLAYNIKKFDESYYIEFTLICSYDELEEIEKYYKSNDNILKYVNIRVDDDE